MRDAAPRAPKELKWSPALHFTPWEKALEAGRTEKKPIVVVIHDGGELSHDLARHLGREDAVSLLRDVVLVRLEQGELPPEFATVTAITGRLAPRILFIKSEGSLDRTLRSTSKESSYYYENLGELWENVRVAKDRLQR